MRCVCCPARCRGCARKELTSKCSSRWKKKEHIITEMGTVYTISWCFGQMGAFVNCLILEDFSLFVTGKDFSLPYFPYLLSLLQYSFFLFICIYLRVGEAIESQGLPVNF